jgi:hypothetical protein
MPLSSRAGDCSTCHCRQPVFPFHQPGACSTCHCRQSALQSADPIRRSRRLLDLSLSATCSPIPPTRRLLDLSLSAACSPIPSTNPPEQLLARLFTLGSVSSIPGAGELASTSDSNQPKRPQRGPPELATKTQTTNIAEHYPQSTANRHSLPSHSSRNLRIHDTASVPATMCSSSTSRTTCAQRNAVSLR